MREQHHQDLATREKRIKPLVSVKHLDVGRLSWRSAPARDVKAELPERRRRRAPEGAETHNANADLARRWLLVVAPVPFALLGVIKPLPAVVEENVQRDILRHAHGEVGIDNAHDRNIRQQGIGQKVIDPGPQGKDRSQIW